MLLVVNWIFFLLFLLLRKWEPVEKEPNFSARSDQYSSVAIFTDFANLSQIPTFPSVKFLKLF